MDSDSAYTARRKFDMAVLREAIAAGVQAHGAGKILPSEMPVDSKTNTTVIRSAPSFSVSGTDPVPHPYTTEVLAKFLGFVKSQDRAPTSNFLAAFGAVELIEFGALCERGKSKFSTSLSALYAGRKR